MIRYAIILIFTLKEMSRDTLEKGWKESGNMSDEISLIYLNNE